MLARADKSSAASELVEDEKSDESSRWEPVPRADWREDASYSRKCPVQLVLAKAARLEAIASLKKGSSAAFRESKPQTYQAVVETLEPLLLSYAEKIFDSAAASRLGGKDRATDSEAYTTWLKSEVAPAVVIDVCESIFGQFPITLRYVAESIPDASYPADLAQTRRSLFGVIAREILRGRFTTHLEKRLCATLAEERIPYWEARALTILETPVSATEPADSPSPSAVDEGSEVQSPENAHGAEAKVDLSLPVESSEVSAAEAPATATLPRRRGFPADMARHSAIAAVVAKHAPRWSEKPYSWRTDKVLKAICADLDAATAVDEAGLYDVPIPWKEGKTECLEGTKIKNWSDALDHAGRKLVVDQIKSSLKMVEKKGVQNKESAQP
jgi:hypothetical protein